MADKRISQLIERVTIANNDVLPIVASGATTTNKVTVSTLQDWMQNNLDVGVTSIGITIGSSGTDINVTGSPVTTSGNITINIPTASATNRGLLSSSDWTTFNNKLSSVGLSMPSAFTVTNSPLTSNGTIAVTGAGTVSQYIRGDGSLADFPEAGGGGASVSYYLNGSVSQGTIGGIAYYEMNKTPILGAGTDFTIAADGYISSFITDAGDPSLLEIPGGNWNFESYFQASSGGGSPSFYIELYKVNSGGTATLIASNSANPELIAFGTTTTAYFSTLAVPTTTLALTDRLAVRFYVTHAGRTITMHTENSNLCQVITTFTTGLTALNGLTAQVQNFATGTSGIDFAISSAGSTHTFNLPDASASARGVVTTGSQVFGGVKTFANGLSLSAVGGSNQTTRIVNIGTLHEGTASVNQIGFNSGNNIYFGKGLNNGGVISWNNAAVRYYTLPDADGTIALTSDLGNYVTLGTTQTITGSKTFNNRVLISNSGSLNTLDILHSSGSGIAVDISKAGDGEGLRVTKTSGTGNAVTITGGLLSAEAATLTGALNGTSASFNTTNAITLTASDSRIRGGDTTGRLLLANSGTTTYGIFHGSSHATLPNAIQFYNDNTLSLTLASTGAATFTGDITASSNAYFGTFNGNDKYHFEPFTNAAGGANNAYFVSGKTDNNERSGFVFQARNSNGEEYNAVIVEGHNSTSTTTPLTISSTGAATFSSSVTANTGLTVGSLSSGSNAIITLANNASGSPRTIYYKASDATINFTGTGGTDQVTITNGGNVGIGTASPLQPSAGRKVLTINGDAGGSAILNLGINNTLKTFLYTDSANTILEGSNTTITLNASGSNFIALQTADTERMRITSGGNVGIGVTPSAWSGIVRGFQVGQGASFSANTATTDAYMTSNCYYDGSTWRYIKSGEFALSYDARGGTGDYVWQTAPSGTAGSAFTFTERMRITSGGNVGIGTASPATTLHVLGGAAPVIFAGNSTTFYTTYRYNTSTDVGYIGNGQGVAIGGGQTDFGFQATGNMLFAAGGGSERMRITSGGVLQMSNNATTFSIGSISGQNRIQWDSTEFSFLNTANSYTALGASAFNTRSDYRLKENVAPVQDALSKITSLKPCTFNFIAEPEKEVVGFIAHEVQEIFPQAISGEKDEVRIEQVEVSPAELDEEGNVITEAVIEEKEVPVYQGIDHSKLVPLLVAAIQEQQEQIKSLTEQVDSLKNQIK